MTAGPTSNVGPVQLTLNSSAATQFCSAQTALATYAVPAAPFGPFAGCGVASDLATPLLAYNPGWSAPFAGSTWIGPNATSNEYKTLPGRYVFQQTFTVPAGVTSPVLNISTLSDNAITVFLNGFQINTQVIQDCAAYPNCNWVSPGNVFVSSDNTHIVTGTNTITIALVDTPNGGFPPTYACTRLPQPNGSHGFTADNAVPTAPDHIYAGFVPGNLPAYAAAGCQNPTGLDYTGTVSWVVPVTTWCSPGFWKNHGRDLWMAYYTKLYSSLVGAAPLGKKAPTSGPGSNPTLLDVIDNPDVYGGPATNSVADFLSNKAFGTPIGQGVESCPDNVPTLTLPR